MDRAQLWDHLNNKHTAVPSPLMGIIRDMYSADVYELIDGEKRTGPVSPARGVKQGCPLSPLLFALYVNDVCAEFPRDMGALAGDRNDAIRVSNLMYADDLTLLSNPKNLQNMLNSLSAYALRKGLTVNVQKSQVVVFNPSRRAGAEHNLEFMLNSKPLEIVSEFKFLGVVFHEAGGMASAAEYAVRPFHAGLKHAADIGADFCVEDNPHAMLWLFQSFALSAGLYGSQVWCTPLLTSLFQGKCTTDLHTRHLGFLKRLLKVKRSTNSSVILRECGQLPLHFYWLRSTIKFWNSCVDVSSSDHALFCGLLRDVMFAELQLSRVGRRKCWSRDVMEALRFLGVNASLASNQSGGVGEPHLLSVDLAEVMSAAYKQLKSVWALCSAHDPRATTLPERCGRKLVTYEQWMSMPWEREAKPPLPPYLNLSLPKNVRRDMARFRMSSHHLHVETGRWQGAPVHDRICALCGGPVQDEKHVLLECEAFVNVRGEYHDLLADCGGDMKDLLNNGCANQIAWLVHKCMKRIDEDFFGE